MCVAWMYRTHVHDAWADPRARGRAWGELSSERWDRGSRQDPPPQVSGKSSLAVACCCWYHSQAARQADAAGPAAWQRHAESTAAAAGCDTRPSRGTHEGHSSRQRRSSSRSAAHHTGGRGASRVLRKAQLLTASTCGALPCATVALDGEDVRAARHPLAGQAPPLSAARGRRWADPIVERH